MRADNSRHIITAAQKRAEQTRRRAVAALRRLDVAGTTITFDSVAREAGVSRSWIYAQADLRSEIERLRARQQWQPAGRVPPQRQRASEPSLLRRLEAATTGSAGSRRRTANYGTRSSKPSANGARPPSAARPTAATRPESSGRN